MEATIKVLNDLVADGVIEKYAIGGAVGATFWLEPFFTEDLDVFVLLPSAAHFLDPLREIFGALRARHYAMDGEFWMIEGVPVQFLPADDQLTRDALHRAVVQAYASVQTNIIRAEYLLALALKTGRGKDFERVSRFLEKKDLDLVLTRRLIRDHGLRDQAAKFNVRYPEHSTSLTDE